MRKNKGYTLIELLLVLGLVSILSGSILYVYKKRTDSVQAQNLIQMARDMDRSVQNFVTVSTDAEVATSLTNANLLTSNTIAVQYRDGSKIVNNYGGDVTITSEMYAGKRVYRMKLEAVPELACVRAATDLGRDSVGVFANGGTVKALGSTAESDPALASTFCVQASNTVEVVRNIIRPISQTLNDAKGNIGNPDSHMVPDLAASNPAGYACPASTTYGTYGCACAEGTLWDGRLCVPVDAAHRINGTTLGTAIPTGLGTATNAHLLAGTVTGTANNYNNSIKGYTPTYNAASVARPGALPSGESASVNVAAARLAITDQSPASSPQFCTNGLVWNGSACSATSTFTSTAGSTPITAVYDTNKYKTCIVGTIDAAGRCQLPNDTKTNTAPTVLQSNVAMNGSMCTNGQSWNGSACACTGGTTLNANNYCACAAGTRFNKDTQSCAPG